MKAWLLESLSGLSALKLSDSAPRPVPKPGEVIVRLHFAGLNPADRFLAENLYPARPPLPHILGRDGCGTVTEVGEGVTGLRVGERVLIIRNEVGVERPGTFAEFVAVPAEWIVPAPENWTDEESAAASLVYLTAYQALHQWDDLEADTILVTGSSGGVGLAAIHLARAEGQHVIALSRGDSKKDRLLAEGADVVFDSNDEGLKAKCREFTGGKGVQLVVDNVGGKLFDRLLDTLSYRGCISVVGMLGGPVPQFSTARLLFKRVRVGGVLVFDYSPSSARDTWNGIVRSLDEIKRRPVVDRVFAFSELLSAFEHLARGPLGKVLLRIAE